MLQFNYFNYFTEIEEAFVALRGAPMMISPLDWALIESWKTLNIPLQVALRGIAKAFSKQSEPNKIISRKVNSLFYCQQSVLEEFSKYCETRIGETTPTDNTEEKQVELSGIIDYLQHVNTELNKAEQLTLSKTDSLHHYSFLIDSLQRTQKQLTILIEEIKINQTIDTQTTEHDLTRFEEMLNKALLTDVPKDKLEESTNEAKAELKPHKKRMDKNVFKQVLDNHCINLLRREYSIPRLSLFYMNI